MEPEEESKEEYVRRKVISRELTENMRLHGPFVGKNNFDNFIKEMNLDRKKIKISENSDVGKAYGLVYDAIEYLNRHMDQPGLELIDNALKLDVRNEEALAIKMDVLMSYERFAEAETCAEKLIGMGALHPDAYANAYYVKAQVTTHHAYELGERRMLASALGFIEQGLEGDGQNYDLVMLKAGVLYQLGRREYRKWVDKAYKLDKRRTEMFMEHYWIKERLI